VPLFLKALLTLLVILVVVETAKRNAAMGALVASLPLISVLGMAWLWLETGDRARLASHSAATFWYVLPSLPMFLVIPMLLRTGLNFWLALGAGILLTAVLYLMMVAVLGRFGVRL
jgi:hypothetical protein